MLLLKLLLNCDFSRLCTVGTWFPEELLLVKSNMAHCGCAFIGIELCGVSVFKTESLSHQPTARHSTSSSHTQSDMTGLQHIPENQFPPYATLSKGTYLYRCFGSVDVCVSIQTPDGRLGRPPGRPSGVCCHTYIVRCDISAVSWQISVNLRKNVRHVSTNMTHIFCVFCQFTRLFPMWNYVDICRLISNRTRNSVEFVKQGCLFLIIANSEKKPISVSDMSECRVTRS